jgi:hypothetical protein
MEFRIADSFTETHPKTGAAQIVEIRETIQEIRIPRYVVTVEPAKLQKELFVGISDSELLGYGVPTDWAAQSGPFGGLGGGDCSIAKIRDGSGKHPKHVALINEQN